MSAPGRVLVLTIGTGNRKEPETTLFRPLDTSVRQGDWTKIVLLPSTATSRLAEAFVRRCPGLAFEVKSLREDGMENDADACFGHFDGVLGELLEHGWSAESIVADFTRGTKAMSAALVLAAVRRGLPSLRYIGGERDKRGLVQSGKEKVMELPTALATGHRLLDEARSLMRSRDFSAVLTLVPDLSVLPSALRPEGDRLRRLAAFYGAWDRLDYQEARSLAGSLDDAPGITDAISWVQQLATEPDHPSDHAGMAQWLRAVACDLLENGRRRLCDGRFEDSMVRAYRVRELMGQFLLFDRGMDSSSLDPESEPVKKLRDRLCKKGSQDFGTSRDRGRLTAGSHLAARLLKQMGERSGSLLLKFDESESDKLGKRRNASILIHGFKVRAPSPPSAMETLYDDLEALLSGISSETPKMIERAGKCAFRE